MKKRLLLSMLLLAAVLLSGCAAAQGERVVVTSFYPMYIFTQNVCREVPGVTVVNMADQNVGCLHDYQLQTRDMVTLEGAFALVINGGGMEQFMDKVVSLREDLPVIDASAGVEMLCAQEAHDGHDHESHAGHDHAHDGHDHLYNAHVWLDPALAAMQIGNIAEGLAAADPENAAAYRQNAADYAARLSALDSELSRMLAPFAGSEIITFHEAFSYFAAAYDLVVAGVISTDDGEEPGTREIAAICDLVKEHSIRSLFIEPQYPARSADTIARETGAAVYTLDPVVSGDGTMESYEMIMRENARVLAEALSQ